jgi:hypothetical protein
MSTAAHDKVEVESVQPGDEYAAHDKIEVEPVRPGDEYLRCTVRLMQSPCDRVTSTR